MALFSRKKKPAETTEVVQSGREEKKVLNSSTGRDLSHILMQARITEKATMHSGESVFTFNVARSASKRDIMQAVKALYGVVPRAVRVVSIPTKATRNSRTGRTGTSGGGKKAYVYLKKGESINIA